MTLDEAMTDLSIQREVKRRLGKDYQAESNGLGIEALKRVKDLRRDEPPFKTADELLPGETEEAK